MKKLYYSFIILLVVVVGLVLPKAKAAGEFDDTAHYKGFIEDFETEIRGGREQIVGAWVYIHESSLPVGDFPRYMRFGFEYFQPDVLVLLDDMIGRWLIWNPFDDRASGPDYFGGEYNGAWWLLIGYEYISDNIADAYEYGYESGYNNGFNAGEQVGYENGYFIGYDDGFEYGLDIGHEAGELQGWTDGYDDGYRDGLDDGREQVLNSIGEIGEILFQDIVLPNGVKDEIINNEILVDRVGMVVFDGSENWNFAYHPGGGYLRFNLDGILANSSINLNNTDDWISNLFESKASEKSECLWIDNNITNIVIHQDTLTGYGGFVYGLTSTYVPALKGWLAAQKNAGEPLTVWYQYAETKQYDLVSLLTNEDGSFADGYNKGYNDGRVHVQRENKSLLSVIPTIIGSIWLMVSDFLSFEVFGLNLWAIIIVFASFSLLVLIIKMVI